MTTLYILIYIVGCILAYGRAMAIIHSLNEDIIHWSKPSVPRRLLFWTVLLSWLSFLALTIIYFTNYRTEHVSYFKWHIRDLVDRYNHTHKS